MSALLDTPLWHRVAQLRPALRSHVEIRRHVYRGKPAFIIIDPASGRHHRLSPASRALVSRMNGEHTVQEIWDALDRQESPVDEHEMEQEDLIRLLVTLHAADLLDVAIAPDVAELMQRGLARQSKQKRGRFMNPLAMRFPLLDPDRLLNRMLPVTRLIFSGPGLLLWLLIVCAAAILAGMHWSELTTNVRDRVLTPGNLVLIWFTYPIIKALHELGHGCAAKLRGGEVHETGLMLLVFTPVPYVDASCSAAFSDKRHRMLVGAAGILVELLVASLAMFIWAAAEPGIVRAIAFNTMLIGAASTVLINGNPLLRYDGYHVLVDALEIPNLAKRANRYAGYLVRRFLFGFSDLRSPAKSTAEASWLAGYALTSFAYRMFIMFAIIFFVAGKFFFIGTMLACWAIGMQLIWPAIRSARTLINSDEFQDARSRNVARGAVAVVTIAVLLGALPLPLTTHTEGVVWLPPESEVRASVDAVVTKVVAKPGSIVEVGDLLLQLEDPELEANVRMLEAELAETQARYDALRTGERVDAQILHEEIDRIRADLDLALQRSVALTVRSKWPGRFILSKPYDLEGRFVRNGELLAFVALVKEGTVVAAVSQNEIGLIRARTDRVTFRLTEQIDRLIRASIRQQTPAASTTLRSPVLGSLGGGRFATDPGDERGMLALEEVFHIELASTEPVQRFGERVHVRFDHGYQPLAMQWYRSLRQVFMRQLSV